MSEQEQVEQTTEEPRKIEMEEMGSALYGSAKQGVDLVLGTVGGLFKYSWMGFQYAGDDIKQLSSKALEKVQKQDEKAEAEATA